MNENPAPPTNRRTGAPARPRKRPSAVKRLFGVVVLGALIGGGVWAGKLARTATKTNNVKVWWDIYAHPESFFPGKDKITVLLIGKDYQYDKNYQRYTGKASRADSIMLLSLDFKTKKVSALSIPRDTRVRVAGNTGKINATLSAETYPGKGGPDLLRDAVADITGVRPDYYVALKPDAVGNLVEELKGVDVELIDDIEYHDSKAGLHVKLPKGQVRITSADDAIGYCRYREVDIYQRNPDGSPIPIGRTTFRTKPRSEIARLNQCLENGDTRRMVRQQNMIRAMMTSGKKQFYRANGIIDTAFQQFDTNLEHKQLCAIASLYRGIEADQVASATLAGDFENRRPYFFIPDRRKSEALVQWLVYGDEEAANRVTTVAVQNATDISGAARRVAELLRTQGKFDADFVTTSPKEPVATTTIWFTKAVNKPRAEKIAALIGGGALQKDTTPDTTGAQTEPKPDIRVVLGPDLAPKLTALGEQSARR